MFQISQESRTQYLKKNPRNASLCRVNLCRESIFVVCIIPRSPTPLCASLRQDNLHGVHHTAKTNCIPGIEIFACLWLFLKGQTGEILLRGEHIYHERKYLKYKMLIYKEKCVDSAVCCTPRRQLCDQISRCNRKRIRKYFSLFVRVSDGFKS